MRCATVVHHASWLATLAVLLPLAVLRADEPEPGAAEAIQKAAEAAQQAAQQALEQAKQAASEAAEAASEEARAAAQEAADEAKAAAQEALEQAKQAASEAAAAVSEEARAAAEQAAGEAAKAAHDAVIHVKQRIASYAPDGYQLGLHVTGVPKALDAQLKLEGKGLVVDHVDPDGPAAKAGIEQHDILLIVTGKPITQSRDLLAAVRASDGKDIEIELLRGGEAKKLSVAPAKVDVMTLDIRQDVHGATEDVEIEIHKLEQKIREKLKDAGVDVRMQLFQPGHVLPKGAIFTVEPVNEVPDDLIITVEKQGPKLAEITIKQGDETWTAKEDHLNKLPEKVRVHVEQLLGRRPMQWQVAMPGGKKFTAPLPPGFVAPPGVVPRPPVPPADIVAPVGPGETPQTRERPRGSLEQRLGHLQGEMDRLSDQMNDLRKLLREEIVRPKDD